MSTNNSKENRSRTPTDASTELSSEQIESLFDQVAEDAAEAIFEGRKQEQAWRISKGVGSPQSKN